MSNAEGEKMNVNGIGNGYRINPIYPMGPLKNTKDQEEQRRREAQQESFTKVLKRTQNKIQKNNSL